MDTPFLGPVLIIGASDQGEVVLDLLRSLPRPPAIHGFLDSGTEGRFVGHQVGGIPVLDVVSEIGRYAGAVAGAIPAVGSARQREAIAAVLDRERVPMLSAVHPGATLARDVEIGAGTVVAAGAIVGVGARVGLAAIVNTGAIVEHHCRVGDFAHVAPGSRLAGSVRVGERAWIGMGATVLENRCVGPDAEIGAGAVVTRDVAAGVTVIGVPARPLEPHHPEKDLV